MLSFLMILFSFRGIQSWNFPDTDAPIGNYSQNIPLYSQCGLTKTVDEKEKCFQYHKDFFPRIIGQRDVRLGDAPWLVGVKRSLLWGLTSHSCGGSLISERWVFTAAHCLKGLGTFWVWLGPEFEEGKWYEAESVHKHPDHFTDDLVSRTYRDIGLIKLKDKIEFSLKGKYYDHNLICLPDANLELEPPTQFALMSGWGIKGSWYRSDHKLTQIAGVTVHLASRHNVDNVDGLELHQRFINPSERSSCKGDSGSPIWIYHMGRAYQIGIHTSGSNEKESCGHVGGGVYIPDVMDWVFKIIKNN